MAATAHPLLLALLLFKLVNSVTIRAVSAAEYDFCSCSPNGPQHWGDLSPDWALCRTGQEQSPIDILTHNVQVRKDAQGLQKKYHENTAVLKIDDHGIQVDWLQGYAGSLRIDGTNYPLRQFHFHHPSDHTIDGVRFPLEMHAVHITNGGDIAVVGFLYKIGVTEEPFLAQWVTSRLPSMVHNNLTEEDLGLVKLIYPACAKDYYRYNGSLTTPDCSEGVKWTLMTRIFTITEEQLEAIKYAMPEPNARPLQMINGRSVLLYKPRILRQASSYPNI